MFANIFTCTSNVQRFCLKKLLVNLTHFPAQSEEINTILSIDYESTTPPGTPRPVCPRFWTALSSGEEDTIYLSVVALPQLYAYNVATNTWNTIHVKFFRDNKEILNVLAAGSIEANFLKKINEELYAILVNGQIASTGRNVSFIILAKLFTDKLETKNFAMIQFTNEVRSDNRGFGNVSLKGLLEHSNQNRIIFASYKRSNQLFTISSNLPEVNDRTKIFHQESIRSNEYMLHSKLHSMSMIKLYGREFLAMSFEDNSISLIMPETLQVGDIVAIPKDTNHPVRFLLYQKHFYLDAAPCNILFDNVNSVLLLNYGTSIAIMNSDLTSANIRRLQFKTSLKYWCLVGRKIAAIDENDQLVVTSNNVIENLIKYPSDHLLNLRQASVEPLRHPAGTSGSTQSPQAGTGISETFTAFCFSHLVFFAKCYVIRRCTTYRK